MKRKYKIPVTWTCYGLVEVSAKDETEAVKLVQSMQVPDSLPPGDYIEDSLAVDKEGIPFYNS